VKDFKCGPKDGGFSHSCKCASSGTASQKLVIGKQRMTITVTAQSSLQTLIDSLDSKWVVTKEIKVAGLTLKVGDRVLREGSLAGASSREDIVKSISTGTLTLVVSVTKLTRSQLTGRRRRRSGFTNACPAKKALCESRCKANSMELTTFNCRWASNIGTRYQCKCASSSTSTTRIATMKKRMLEHLKQTRVTELRSATRAAQKKTTVTAKTREIGASSAGSCSAEIVELRKLVEKVSAQLTELKQTTEGCCKAKP